MRQYEEGCQPCVKTHYSSSESKSGLCFVFLNLHRHRWQVIILQLLYDSILLRCEVVYHQKDIVIMCGSSRSQDFPEQRVAN